MDGKLAGWGTPTRDRTQSYAAAVKETLWHDLAGNINMVYGGKVTDQVTRHLAKVTRTTESHTFGGWRGGSTSQVHTVDRAGLLYSMSDRDNFSCRRGSLNISQMLLRLGRSRATKSLHYKCRDSSSSSSSSREYSRGECFLLCVCKWITTGAVRRSVSVAYCRSRRASN